MTERRGKYNAHKVTENGYTFDSGAEARRYRELKLMQGANQISCLVVHPMYALLPAFTHIGGKERPVDYIADFRYWDEAIGAYIVEDVKGVQTDIFKLKRKILLWRYPNMIFRIVEAR